jgi:cell division septum initiation protein DivIVA
MSEVHDPTAMPADVESRLSELERLVAEARAIPLSSSVRVDRGEIEAIVGELRETIPDEVFRARRLMRDKAQLLEHAQEDAAQILADARAERDRLIAQERIVAEARREADAILEEARDAARRVKLEAEDYVDAKLANFEVVLHKVMKTVDRGRQTLRGRLESDQLTDEELEATRRDAEGY